MTDSMIPFPQPPTDGSVGSTKIGYSQDALDERDHGNILIEEKYVTAITAVKRYSMLRKRGTTDRGVRFTFGQRTNPAVVTFTNGTNTLTCVDNAIQDDSFVNLSTDGALPAELSTSTQYYAVNVSGDTLQVSLTEGGSAVAFTDDGSGTSTIDEGYQIWPIAEVEEGELRPAYYFPFVPTYDPGAYAERVLEDRRYHRVEIEVSPIGWVVPAEAAGFDRILVQFIGVNGDSEGLVLVNDVQVGTYFYTGSGTSEDEEATIILSTPLAENDTVRLSTSADGNKTRPSAVTIYQSDGIVDGAAERILIDPTSISASGSSIEWAYRTAATGDTVRYCGGAAHQGGSYNTQTDVVEVFRVGTGASFTLEHGYKQDAISITRTSKVRDTNEDKDLATVSEVYKLTGDLLVYEHTMTLTQALDTGAMYPGMLVGPTGGNGYWACEGWVHDLSEAAGETIQGPPGADKMILGGDMENTRIVMLASDFSHRIFQMRMETTTKNKGYFTFSSAVNLSPASGEVFYGGWSYWAEYDAV